jgi:hypothetical protein
MEKKRAEIETRGSASAARHRARSGGLGLLGLGRTECVHVSGCGGELSARYRARPTTAATAGPGSAPVQLGTTCGGAYSAVPPRPAPASR